MKRRTRGRPRAAPKTIKLLKEGTARLSHDLAKVGDKFTVRFNGSRIFLDKTSEVGALLQQASNGYKVVEAYGSNDGAASPLISLMGTLAMMGLPRESQDNLSGTYKAIVSKDRIEFDLDKVEVKV